MNEIWKILSGTNTHKSGKHIVMQADIHELSCQIFFIMFFGVPVVKNWCGVYESWSHLPSGTIYRV